MPRNRPILVLALLAVLAVGCGTLDVAGRTFGGTLPQRGIGGAVDVAVVDRTGQVSGIELLDRLPDGLLLDGSVLLGIVPDDPTALVVAWLGGACDRRTTIALDREGLDRTTVTVTTDVEPGGCRAVGIQRAVILRMGGPVDLSRFGMVTL